MALNNLRDGQTADEFPAMSESEAAEAQQKYGANARYYLGNDRQENRARENAYRLARTFANGEHAPPGVGIVPSALATAGQTINTAGDWIASAARGVNGMLGLPGPSPQNSDGGDGYDNARLAVNALSGIQGRLRAANYWSRRGAEQPELAFDQITGANSPSESALNFEGLGNKLSKSDGYYQYSSNALKNIFGSPSKWFSEQGRGEIGSLLDHERTNNRTTPIVPDSAKEDPEQLAGRAEAANLFEEYKAGVDDYPAAIHSRILGVNPPQFVKDFYSTGRDMVSDPINLAFMGTGAILGGAKGGAKGVIANLAREMGEETVENAGISSTFMNPYDYFFTPVTDNALTGDVDPRDANAYKSALEAGLLEQESKLKRATNLMRPK
jgi:hypothetical protein